MMDSSNDMTNLVLGIVIGGIAGYFAGPKIGEGLFPIGYLPPGSTTQEIEIYNMHAQDRSRAHTFTTYGSAIAGAVLGGYLGKKLG